MRWRQSIVWGIVVNVGAGCGESEATAPAGNIAYFHLRGPGHDYDIEQASGLHYGRLGEREGLWIVCDRNGGRSAGRLFFVSKATLGRAVHAEAVVADEMFVIAPPEGGWEAFSAVHRGAGETVLAELARRIQGTASGEGPMLDLEAVTIAPSPTPPYEPRVFVAAEEPFSTILELRLEGQGAPSAARLVAVYAYREAAGEAGTDRNDGLEGLAGGDAPGAIHWCEEGTRFHDGPPGPRLFFLDPRLGRGMLKDGAVAVDREASDALTAAVRARRAGRMQTLNALTVTPGGRLLAVDRNGGWVLRVDPDGRTAEPWLNLYDLDGVNLRELLARFPGPREMPYISIEGIAVDPAGTLYLADDPAMPEAFRASALLRINGLEMDPPRP